MKMKVGEIFSLAFLSILLAFFFWVVATEAQDPMLERPYPASIPIEIRNIPDGMILYGEKDAEARVVLRAPESLWAVLQAPLGDIEVYVDLSGAEPGQLTVPVQVDVNRHPTQLLSVSPVEITLTLEQVAELDVPVEVRLQGTPALGFVTRAPSFAPQTVTVRGPRSLVTQTVRALVRVSVDESRDTLRESLAPMPVDELGNEIENVDVSPRAVTVEVPVEQLGNIRDLAVHVVLIGQPAPGYRVGAVEKEPPSVAVSGLREVVQALPGYINTEPIDLNGVDESFTTTVGFQSPEGISVLTTPQVLVTVNLEQLKSTLTVDLTPELQGLRAGYTATVQPETVQVVVRGPFATVEAVDAAEIIGVLDLTGLLTGTHTVPLQVSLPDEALNVEGIIPQSSLAVEIQESP